jgi:phosphoribosyl-AMP cyclohydrolase
MLEFDSQGLVPAVIVDDVSGDVLMVAFMSRESLQLTRETGQTHFYSRSRQKIWHKGEESGNTQEVRDIFVNCEENSLLIRVVQQNGAACHEGYHSCYYRRLLPDDSYQTVAERIFDPEKVYHHSESAMTMNSVEAQQDTQQKLEAALRQLYTVYTTLRDQDLQATSNTSRLLHAKDQAHLVSRVQDELDELRGVVKGEHVHKGREADTALEGSQVGYWLCLLAAIKHVTYDDFMPHASILHGYTGQYATDKVDDLHQTCLQHIASNDPVMFARGLMNGFSLIGWACVSVGISPLSPVEYDLAQMRAKGLIQ